MAKKALDISPPSQRLQSFRRPWSHKRYHKRMQDNKLSFTTSWLETLKSVRKRMYFSDSRVTGLTLELMPSGSKIFRFCKKVKGRLQKATIGPYPKVGLQEARDAAIKLSARLVDGEEFTHSKDELTLRDLANLYFDTYAEGRCTTVKEMRKDFDRYWSPIHMHKLSQIDINCIQVGVNKIGARGTYGVANKALTLVRAMFGFALKRQLVVHNPAINVPKFPEKPRKRFVQDHEHGRLLQAIENHPDDRMRDFFKICLYTGIRSGTVKSASWSDIDLIAGMWTYTNKNKDLEVMYLSQVVMDILKERFKYRRLSPWIFQGGRMMPNGRIRYIDGPLSSVNGAWKRICAKAGITGLRIHDLRRTLGVNMIATGASTAIVQKQLGHRSLAAAQIYQRVAPTTAKDCTDKAIESMRRHTAL